MILIAVPTFEHVQNKVFEAIWCAAAGRDADFACVSGYDCARARNAIAHMALDGGYSHVLMVDSDTDPPAEIVLGFYRRKDGSQDCFEMFKDEPGWKMFSRADISEAPDRIAVKGGGFGCALVDSEVFKRLRFPWFKFEQYDDGSILSEDLYFSRIALNAGIKTYADTRVLCGHVGTRTWE
jgi:hypothetical protein